LSNFRFLRAEWPDLSEEAARSEQHVHADPRAACFYARRTLELSLGWLFDADRALRPPYKDNLAAKINEPSLHNLVGPDLRTKMDAIRLRGNHAVHDRQPVAVREALAVVRELFHVLYWLARHYTRDPTAVPASALSFDEALIPLPAATHVTTQAELAALEDRLAAQDAALAADREKSADLDAELAALRTRVAAAKAANAARPDTHDYDEATTRDEYVDLLLREAGWRLDQPRDREFRVTGMPPDGGVGLVDYVLWGEDGTPLAVVEAKRTRRDAITGQQQAKLYADCLEAAYRQRPVIYYTNGYETWLWDDTDYPPRPVRGFHTRDELRLLIQRRTTRRLLVEVAVDPAIVERYYQRRAIARITEAFDRDRQRKALLVMATGAGKTRTAVALVDVLMRAGWVKRVLFLADRVALVRQATNAFKTHLPDVATVNVVEEKSLDGRVLVATYPTIMGLIDQTTDGVRRLGPGHFDLVIIDEAHRSVYQKYRAIFAYFDSLLLGLTATPKDEVDRNTYRLFALEEGVPTDAYHLTEAVADGFLVPFRAVSVPLRFPREGIRYDELSDDEKDQWDALEWDEEGRVPDSVEAAALNAWLFNADTVDKMLETLMTRGHRVASGDRLGKTIIFARNIHHAEFIAERFNANYPEHRGEFARVVTHQTAYAQSLIGDFAVKDKPPHIAISVDMLDTGIDVPEIVNLVFFKPVYSRTKFWQMLGRGTRLCPGLFGSGRDKQDFFVFDCCQNFAYFNQDHPDVEGELAESLTERLFKARLELVRRLDQRQPVDHPPPEDGTLSVAGLRWDFVHSLHSRIRGMSVENFLVRPHRRLVETYSDLDRWRHLTPAAAEEIGGLAGLPSRERDDDEAAKRFDLLVLRLQFARLTADPGFPRLCQQVREIASALLAQTSIPAIRERREMLEAAAGADWWQDVTLPMLELLRRQVRSLARLIEKSKRALVFTDFADQLGEIAEMELAGFPAGTDLDRFRAKVRVYLRDHEDHLAVQKLRRNRQLSPTDLAELERIVAECGGEPEIAEARRSASGLGLFIRALVGLDREAAKEAFGEFLTGRRFTADQIHFVDMIIDQLTANGVMEPARLYEPPFTDLAPHGPESLFPAADVDRLVTVLRRVQETAEPAAAAA
jgi:type I restriction enzyme R subunit